MDKKSCFIIMPFSRANVGEQKLDEKTLTYIYEEMIKKAISEYKQDDKIIFNEISRYNSKVGSIVSGIAKNLNSSDLVVADLTGLNPNVMYELGVRHALKRGTIIITQDFFSLPSDLRDYMCIPYSYPEKSVDYNACYEQFKKDLHKTIDELFTTEKYDSPVLNYLNGKQQYWMEDELKKLKANIVVAYYIIDHYEKIKEHIEKIAIDPDSIPYTFFNSLINNLDSGIQDLNISIEASMLYEDIRAAKSIIADLLKRLHMAESFDSMFWNMLPSEGQELFKNPRTPLLEVTVLDYFALNDGERKEVSFKEIFSDEGDFNNHFIEGIEKYIEEKAKELGLSEKEIEEILSN